MLLQGLGGQRLVHNRGADLPLDRNAEAVVFRDARLDYAGLKTRAVSSPGRVGTLIQVYLITPSAIGQMGRRA